MATMASTLQQPSVGFAVRPLSAALGGDTVGIDLRQPIDATVEQKCSTPGMRIW